MVPVLCLCVALAACGPGPAASSGRVTLRIARPTQNQVLTNGSLDAQVQVGGLDSYCLYYYLDGGHIGGCGADSMTALLLPGRGNHRLEVEVLDATRHPLKPALRAGVDFTLQ